MWGGSHERRHVACREAGAEDAAEEGEEPEEDEELELSPEKGNVAFASAADGWAFRTGQFAALYAAKLGFSAAALQRALWGDYRLDVKAKRIAHIRASQQGKHKPLFVQVGPRLSLCTGLCSPPVRPSSCLVWRCLWPFALREFLSTACAGHQGHHCRCAKGQPDTVQLPAMDPGSDPCMVLDESLFTAESTPPLKR